MKKINVVLAPAFILCVGVFAAFAQDQTITSAAGDKYVISAKPGGVGYIEGMVGIVRKSGPSGRLLKGDNVEIGDRVSTATDGRAEILLNPGSYLRVGGGSAFEFKTTSLDDLQIRLDRGNAIFEVFAGNGFFVTVATPRAKFKLINSGIFRLDVDSDGGGTLSVWKGRAQVGRTEAGIIKEGRAVTVSGSKVAIAKFDRGNGDSLDQWSKTRGKQLAKVTSNLKRRELRNSLLSSYNGRQWGMYDSFGLWILDRFTGSYCFLPFGYGWYSPYGYGYGHHIGRYDIPWATHTTPSPTTPGTATSTPQPVTQILTAGDRSPIPPFVRMQGGFGGSRDTGGGRNTGFDPSPGINNTPVYSPPPEPVKMHMPSATSSKKGEN
jgi:hypothetical protein